MNNKFNFVIFYIVGLKIFSEQIKRKDSLTIALLSFLEQLETMCIDFFPECFDLCTLFQIFSKEKMEGNAEMYISCPKNVAFAACNIKIVLWIMTDISGTNTIIFRNRCTSIYFWTQLILLFSGQKILLINYILAFEANIFKHKCFFGYFS